MQVWTSVWIVGGGVSGLSAQKALNNIGCHCVISQGEQCLAGEFDLIVVSPGIKPTHPVFNYALERNIPLIGELELGYLLSNAHIIAVTGTNGKTTTTMLISKMLGISACGNIGVPLCNFANSSEKLLVAEVSSFQLMTIKSFHPKVAAIINIEPDHLDYHKDMDEYVQSKLNIAKNMVDDDILILPDTLKAQYLKDFKPQCKVIMTSMEDIIDGAYISQNSFYWFDKKICDVSRFRLSGGHNLQNALIAIAATKSMGADDNMIIDALTTCEVSKHRLELIKVKNGKAYYNDSKATNPAAAVAASKTMTLPTCIILGGSDKLAGFTDMFKEFSKQIMHAIVVGNTRQRIMDAALEAGFTNIHSAQTLDEAVKKASDLPVENVLFSPACASFDSFNSYIERGQRFIEIVNKL